MSQEVDNRGHTKMNCSKEIKKIPKHQLYKTNGSPYFSDTEGCGNEKMN